MKDTAFSCTVEVQREDVIGSEKAVIGDLVFATRQAFLRIGKFGYLFVGTVREIREKSLILSTVANTEDWEPVYGNE